MTTTLDNDPISQLPEPYRVAWDILHEPFDYENILRTVLVNAQKMSGAVWGMMILDTDLQWLRFTFPSFHTLPDVINNTVPIGHISSLAYVLGRKVVQDSQNILIADTNNIIELDEALLLDDFLPLRTRTEIKKRAEENWFASSVLEISNTSSFTAMVVPIVEENKSIGAMYLHRPASQGIFSNEILEKIRIFLSCVAIGIINADHVKNLKHSAFQILYTFTSEFRTPLISTHGFAKILLEHPSGLKEDLGQNTEAENSFLKIILDNTDRMKDMLDLLLLEAKIEQKAVNISSANLSIVIGFILEKYRPLIQAKNQSFLLEMPSTLDAEVFADSYLSEVIDTLVKNAYLYTPKGGEIKISTSLIDHVFRFQISDTGFGLTDDEIANLFERFYRSQRKEIQDVSGVGLGLYLAKRLIELWGGQIGAEGSLNQGSTFWFTLPMSKE
jgi:signal transduction histidine kinase